MNTNNPMGDQNNPPEPKEITMAQVNAGDIRELGLHMNLSGQSYYIDLEVGHLSREMKAQLFKQMHSLVYTYKELHRVLNS